MKTSDLCIDGSIKSITSSIIDFHMWFVLMGIRTNLEGPFDILRVGLFY